MKTYKIVKTFDQGYHLYVRWCFVWWRIGLRTFNSSDSNRGCYDTVLSCFDDSLRFLSIYNFKTEEMAVDYLQSCMWHRAFEIKAKRRYKQAKVKFNQSEKYERVIPPWSGK